MKFAAYLMVALLVLPALAGCVTPSVGEDGVGVAVAPLASLPRVKAGEAKIAEQVTALTKGQIALAEAAGQAEVAAAAAAAQAQADLEQAKLDIADEAAIDWTTIILGALGVSGVAGGGMAYRKRLLNLPPPAQSKEA